jgi:hypothetical protein
MVVFLLEWNLGIPTVMKIVYGNSNVVKSKHIVAMPVVSATVTDHNQALITPQVQPIDAQVVTV